MQPRAYPLLLGAGRAEAPTVAPVVQPSQAEPLHEPPEQLVLLLPPQLRARPLLDRDGRPVAQARQPFVVQLTVAFWLACRAEPLATQQPPPDSFVLQECLPPRFLGE